MKAESRSLFAFELDLVRSGVTRIAGVDEAGRGPLAGPVVVAAVVFPNLWVENGLPRELSGLTDSKQLSPSRRDRYFEFLSACTEIDRGLSVVEAEEIDRLNILRATHAGMVRALGQLRPAVEHVLVDGLAVDSIRTPQTAIVKGDSLSYSIAAASVLAKVTRDRLMAAHHQRWPDYGFGVHKGYPTPAHRRALERLGPSPIHRRSFAPVRAAAVQKDLFER